MNNLKQKCKSFGGKYIGWDGCTTIPVLFILIVILVWMMGWLAFSVFISIFVLIGMIQMHFDKKRRMKGMKNE